MKTELNTECHISNLNDLQENKKENPIEKKKMHGEDIMCSHKARMWEEALT